MSKIILKLLVTFFLIINLSGCINLKLPTTTFTPQHYNLDVNLPKTRPAKTNAGNLEVAYPKIATQFSGQSFVYKSIQYNCITDAYNIFSDLPANEIQQLVISYLQKTGAFKYIATDIYPAKVNYTLKVFITKLYADYSNRNEPKGIIAINFTLFDLQNKNNILLNKDYQANIPLKEKSSLALVKAWNTGLTQILQQLSHNLQAINLEVKPIVKKPLYNPSKFKRFKTQIIP